MTATALGELMGIDGDVPVAPEDTPRTLSTATSGGDRVFRVILRSAGTVVLAIVGLVGLFLLVRGTDALSQDGFKFFTTQNWQPGAGDFGVAAVVPGTLLIAVVAVVVALPLAVGTALYISEYAPRQIKRTLVSLVDLMAAVPSVVYGIWGAFFLQNQIRGVSRWLATWLGWFPPFHVDGYDADNPLYRTTVFTSSSLIAGLVVGLMVTPIACSVMREVFSQAPQGEREGAYALGATRWGVIRSVVLPFGKGGIIGGTMLGLGRAMGETIAVYLIISQLFKFQPHLLQNGGSSVSALIAGRFGAATPFGLSALFAAGLTLFVLTLFVNLAAARVVARSRSGASSDA